MWMWSIKTIRGNTNASYHKSNIGEGEASFVSLRHEKYWWDF